MFGWTLTLTKILGKPRWLAVILRLGDLIGLAGPVAMMNRLACDSIYEDKAVVSARWHGVRGLGRELVRSGTYGGHYLVGLQED